MKKLNLIAIFAVLLISSSLAVNTAHATTWMTNVNPKLSHSTLNQMGKTKICGDHKCAPFEYAKMQQALYDAQRKNQAAHVLKQNNPK